MSGKHLYEDNIVNELKSSSLFFQEDKDAIAETPAKDTHTAPVVPSPAPLQSKTASHPSPLLPPSQEPSQGPTVASIPADMPAADDPSTHNSASIPTVAEVRQSQDNGDGTMDRPDERTNERSTERTKVRHTFDILSDQLFALRELAVERERTFGRKVLLGGLVQEALDLLISRERNHD